ncbi:MAG: hypothetical protein AAF481_06970 [Acidobacteriota bacterium]
MTRKPDHPLPWSALTLLLAVLLTACQTTPSPADSDLQRLQGEWNCRGPGGQCWVTVSGSSLRFFARDDFWYETTFTLRADRAPKQLHATIVEDSQPDEDDVGTVIVTIYKFDNGTLTLGLIDHYQDPPPTSWVGDWEWVRDRYDLTRTTRVPSGE